MTNAIEVNGLRKSYGAKEVLKGIDLCVRQGDIFALLGVNGAGKTTTLECIEGLRKYDADTGTGKIPASVRSSNSTPAQRVPNCRTSWSGCCTIFGSVPSVSA